MQPELRPILVVTSCDREDVCDEITKAVLKKKLAACVQVSQPVRSSYWWQQEIAEDSEYLVSMKTDRRLFEELSEVIRQIHPYDVAEIIAMKIVAIDDDYKRWMRESLKEPE